MEAATPKPPLETVAPVVPVAVPASSEPAEAIPAAAPPKPGEVVKTESDPMPVDVPMTAKPESDSEPELQPVGASAKPELAAGEVFVDEDGNIVEG